MNTNNAPSPKQLVFNPLKRQNVQRPSDVAIFKVHHIRRQKGSVIVYKSLHAFKQSPLRLTLYFYSRCLYVCGIPFCDRTSAFQVLSNRILKTANEEGITLTSHVREALSFLIWRRRLWLQVPDHSPSSSFYPVSRDWHFTYLVAFIHHTFTTIQPVQNLKIYTKI